MIYAAQITTQPEFGKYPEQIFDAPLFTSSWTWVKFEDEQLERCSCERNFTETLMLV